MYRLKLAAQAEQDIEDLLSHTSEAFGVAARERYEALITRGMLDIAENPLRPESLDRSDLRAGIRSLHLMRSRHRALGRVKKPRHVLFYRLQGQRTIEIVRVLHDSMDFVRHLASDDETQI